MSDVSGELEVRAQFSALIVALTRNKQFDAARALWDWAEEWLECVQPPSDDELEELIEEELDDA